MKHKFLKTFLFLLFLLFATDVEALDITRSGRLDITYQYDDKVFIDRNIYIYKIASIDESGHLTYQDIYQGQMDPNNLTTSQWTTLATTISKYQEENKIPYDKVVQTNQEGKASFENLPLGLYLVKVENVKDQTYEYNTSPMLLTLPNYDDLKKEYLYDIATITKTEEKKIAEELEKPAEGNKENMDQTNSNKTDVPYTFDAIFIYIIVAVISILGILIIVYFMTKNRKGKDHDETKKD